MSEQFGSLSEGATFEMLEQDIRTLPPRPDQRIAADQAAAVVMRADAAALAVAMGQPAIAHKILALPLPTDALTEALAKAREEAERDLR